jgi:hypothetical protein
VGERELMPIAGNGNVDFGKMDLSRKKGFRRRNKKTFVAIEVDKKHELLS